MKYPLNRDSFDVSLRFWIERFLYYKLVSLNNYKVKDKESFNALLRDILSGGRNDIDEILKICKKARMIGLIGINFYANPVCKFYNYCIKVGFLDMKEIDFECVSEFVSIETSGLKDISIRNYHFALNNFFAYISENNADEFGSYNYSFKMPSFIRKEKQPLPEFLDENEINSFLDSLHQYKVSKKVPQKIILRNQLMILMILYSGARVNEILNIRLKDVMLQDDFYILYIRGKGNKVRTSYIKKESLQSYFLAWLEVRNEISKDNNLPLFINNKLKPIVQSYIYVVIEELLMASNIRKAKNGAHLLRHSFATLLYKKSKDLILVQESLGHSSLDTSRIYTHFDNDNLKKAANIISDSFDN